MDRDFHRCGVGAGQCKQNGMKYAAATESFCLKCIGCGRIKTREGDRCHSCRVSKADLGLHLIDTRKPFKVS